MRQIEDMQNTFVNYGIVKKIAPLLARKNSQLGMEVMALFDVMLFNANKTVQVNVSFIALRMGKIDLRKCVSESIQALLIFKQRDGQLTAFK